jgi:hypothetical protein
MKITKLLSLFLFLGLLASCVEDDEPGPDEEEEFIDEVILTFTPTDRDEEAVTARWFDADGDGAGSGEVTQGIELEEGMTYTLTMALNNTAEGEDIAEEVEEEGDEHQLFFAFTNDLFADPSGNGNVDGDGVINYNDQDVNGLPIGLSTTWTAGEHTEDGYFTIVLKHQPDLKNANSDASTGGTDLDITFPVVVEHSHDEEEEFIDVIVLTFTPTAGGDAVVVTWSDPDGEGVADGAADGPIDLTSGVEYDLEITLANTIEGEDITVEIEEEGEEHQFFFAFTTDIFSDPTGDGNIDNGADALNYNDEDVNGLPIGLSTRWTTGDATSTTGEFRIVLKHQPEMKSATSDASTGGTDVDIPFEININ